MNMLKLIWLTLQEMARQVWHLPQTVMKLIRRREQRVAVSAEETERLDRIRNPSKYRGK